MSGRTGATHRLRCENEAVTRGTPRAAAVGGLALVAVIALELTWWFAPSSPDVWGPGAETGVDAAYLGNHYSFPAVILARSGFALSGARLHVAGPGCKANLRYLHNPPGPDAVEVSSGTLPGVNAVGQRITPRSDIQLAVVVTPSKVGKCSVDSVDVASSSWAKDRWTSVHIDASVDATQTGRDPRASTIQFCGNPADCKG